MFHMGRDGGGGGWNSLTLDVENEEEKEIM